MKTIRLFEEFESEPNFMGIKGVEKTTPCKYGQPLTDREKSFVKIGPSYFNRVKRDDYYYYCGEFRCEDLRLLPIVIALGHYLDEELYEEFQISFENDKFKVIRNGQEYYFYTTNDLMTGLFIFNMIWALEDPYCEIDEREILEIVGYNIEPVKYLESTETIDELYKYCIEKKYERCLNLFEENRMYFE